MAAGKLRGRKDLDSIHSKLHKVVEASNDTAQTAWTATLLVTVGADVKLIDHQLVPARHPEGIGAPVKVLVIDQRVPNRGNHRLAVGVGPPWVQLGGLVHDH